MSEAYEGVVFRSDERTARCTFAALCSRLKLRLVQLAHGVFGIYRVADRTDAFDQPAVESIARRTSAEVGPAIALFYDSGCAIRAGVLFTDGHREREYGVGDEWWAPYGEDGELVLAGPRLRLSELQRGGEYDCVRSAIDVALEAVAADPWVSADLVKQAFCYDRAQVLADS